MVYNQYGEVINGKKTYAMIANRVKNNRSVIIGWTDEAYTHLDIMFKLNVDKYGSLQRGMQDFYLYVGIIDHTLYGFRPDDVKHPGYIKEKIRMNDDCGDKVATLINGVIKELMK